MTYLDVLVDAKDVDTQCPFHVHRKENLWDPNCTGPTNFPCTNYALVHKVSVRDWLRWLTDEMLEAEEEPSD